MCRSHAEGGQRCAAHTRTKYAAAIASGSPDRIREATIEYASTAEGQVMLKRESERLWATGHAEAAAELTTLTDKGLVLREANQAVARTLNPDLAARHTADEEADLADLPVTEPSTAHEPYPADHINDLKYAVSDYDTSDPRTSQYVAEVNRAADAAGRGRATPQQRQLLTGVPNPDNRAYQDRHNIRYRAPQEASTGLAGLIGRFTGAADRPLGSPTLNPRQSADLDSILTAYPDHPESGTIPDHVVGRRINQQVPDRGEPQVIQAHVISRPINHT